MGRPRIVRSGTLLKRLRQLGYLVAHPSNHLRCAAVIRRSRLTRDKLISLRYLGNYLALSLATEQRRQALMGHYSALPKLLKPGFASALGSGVTIWRKEVDQSDSPLALTLESSALAPMEGELQLRFSYKSDLCVLTFLVAPGAAFDLDCETILFIGGIQGRLGSRIEMREASRLNGEIAPSAMLILALQAFAKVVGVDEILAIGEGEHISLGYSPAQVKFDYRRFWTESGGVAPGRHYRVPIERRQKPLSIVPLSHRARTRRKRDAKIVILGSMERRLSEILISCSEPLFFQKTSTPDRRAKRKASSSRPAQPA